MPLMSAGTSSQSNLLNSGRTQVGQECCLTRLDEALRQVRKLKERWHDTLTTESLRLAEHYCEGRVEIVIDLDVPFTPASRGNIDFSHEFPTVSLRLKVEAPERERFVSDRDIYPSDVNQRNRR